jgi:hypothetical protein
MSDNLVKMARFEQKELERRIIEVTRQRCSFFPSGELEEFERPDWLIPSARLGIEVAQLLPERAEGAMFSPPQLSSFQERVVSIAERTYLSLPQLGPIDVLIYFSNDFVRKKDANAMGRTLAKLVWRNYPRDGRTVMLDDETPDGFSVVRIAPVEGGWNTGGVSDIQCLTYEQLNSRIADKNRRAAEYRNHLPAGWALWLLFATRVPVLWSVSCPPEVTSWRFACEFDRVFLASWEHGVLLLNRT